MWIKDYLHVLVLNDVMLPCIQCARVREFMLHFEVYYPRYSFFHFIFTLESLKKHQSGKELDFGGYGNYSTDFAKVFEALEKV
jgi:hypothetical protein